MAMQRAMIHFITCSHRLSGPSPSFAVPRPARLPPHTAGIHITVLTLSLSIMSASLCDWRKKGGQDDEPAMRARNMAPRTVSPLPTQHSGPERGAARAIHGTNEENARCGEPAPASISSGTPPELR